MQQGIKKDPVLVIQLRATFLKVYMLCGYRYLSSFHISNHFCIDDNVTWSWAVTVAVFYSALHA